jgi:hypothetical protein
MIAMMNALESKLAVRGRIPFGLYSTDIAETVKSVKTANAPANRALAQKQLTEFLDAKAVPLKEELDLLAGYLLSKSPPGTMWVAGPLKKLDKAMSKTVEDYDYAWTLNKDLIRGTLVCDTDQHLRKVADLVFWTCTDLHGMFLIKKDHQKSKRDGGAIESGYSGWNFVVQFKDHNAFGVEIQANTIDMMYGKMSKKDFCAHLRHSEAKYAELQSQHRFPGGLGHALYDIQDPRSGTTEAERNLARTLCSDYCDACRGQFRSPTSPNVEALNKRIQEFGRELKSANAVLLWKHGLDSCGWNAYPFLLTAISDREWTIHLDATRQKPGQLRAASIGTMRLHSG